MTWADLGWSAKAFRLAHVVWGFAGMASLSYVWICAVKRRRDRLLKASVVFLSLEGLALVIGRGDCPLGSVQRSLGDPVPMFELVLPPRAAKAAIPMLVLVTLGRLPRGRGPWPWRHRSCSSVDMGGEAYATQARSDVCRRMKNEAAHVPTTATA